MNCTRIQDMLPDYSVEMLDARTHWAVQAHLSGCEACRLELRAQDAAMALVEQYGALEPPVGLFNGVRNRIEAGDFERQQPAWWAWFYTKPARVGAMSVAMAAVALGLVLPTGGPQTPTDWLVLHPSQGPAVTNSALASSIRQHAMSSTEGPLADRVAWEAMAQLVTQDREKNQNSMRDQNSMRE